jgi:site-specific DNA recombinase
MTIALYARVSTQHQAHAQTIEQQLERLRLDAKEKNYELEEAHIFCDDGHSGSSLSRPALERLRAAVSRRIFDQILITAPDRLARNYLDQMLLVEEFEKAGCHIVFLERSMSSDPHDQLLLQIRGAVAEYERNLITARRRRGRQAKLKAGVLLPWTYAPYGYQLDPDRPRDPQGVRVDKVAAAVVIEIFNRYTSENYSLVGLARYLTEAGIPTATGLARWNATSLRGILVNPTYLGTVYAARKRGRVATTFRSPLQPTEKTPYSVSPRPPEEWLEVCQVPALISQAQYEQAQAKLAQNRQFATRNNVSHAYLLRTLVSCGECGGACKGRPSGTGDLCYYVCRNKGDAIAVATDIKCISRMIPAKELDELVWGDLCEVLSQPQILREALQRGQGGAWLPEELVSRRTGLRKAHQSLQQQIERLTTAYLEQVLSLEEYRRRRQDLEQRQESLSQQIEQLEAQAANSADLAKVAASMKAFCEKIQPGLSGANFEHKRQLVELLIDRVVVTREVVEIRYVVPTTPESENSRFCYLRKVYCHSF